MDQLRVTGAGKLNGEIDISGAKNAALPEICAALLSSELVTLRNVPRLQDVRTMLRLIEHMGVAVQGDLSNGSLVLNAANIGQPEAPYELVKTMRASILTLGPLLARFGHARISLPGGCAIGSRPVDQHIKGLRAMGAKIEVEHGYIEASLGPGLERLQGARISTDMVTVTGTENLMMAACLAQGETILENAAQEPEVVDLAEMLVGMGAQITGHGTSRVRIQGVDRLHGFDHTVVADRIEAGTFLCAVACAGGEARLRYARRDHLDAVIEKLADAGVEVVDIESGLLVRSAGAQSLRSQAFRTTEYPGFPTDMQAQFMVLNAVASGASSVTETIFENRFMHVQELQRLGAHIHVDGRTALIEGGSQLSGANVMATDLRASASLVIAGLVAKGETLIDRIYHLDRGYDRMEVKLRALGAQIERVTAR